MWLRALAFWFGILMLAVANGALREGLLVPAWGVRTGQAASVLMLSTIVLFMARVFVRRAGLTRDRDALGVGLLWLALTLAFEFGFGRARGMPWETLLHDYDVSAGRVWPVVLLCTCVGPWLGLRLTRPPRADPARTPPRRLLGGLLAAIALNAVGGGLYGMSGAPEVPTAWLAGSPFADYTVPSLCLLVGVGGAALAAAVAVLGRRPAARALALLAGGVLVAWIVMQVGVIGPVSWLQPVMFVAGLAVVALASRLRCTP
jgi:hypothetical protein